MFLSRLKDLKIGHLCGKNRKNVVLLTDKEKNHLVQTHNTLGFNKNLKEYLPVNEEFLQGKHLSLILKKKNRIFDLTALFSFRVKVLGPQIHMHILTQRHKHICYTL